MLIEEVIKQCKENKAVCLIELDTKQLADWLCELMQLRYNLAKADTQCDLHDWNDVSNTNIPLNDEIFALLQDRTYSEKLRPAVIIAHMHPAKKLLWTEQTEGDVLCYDVPDGNFYKCNGAHIKYWKHIDVPSEQAKS